MFVQRLYAMFMGEHVFMLLELKLWVDRGTLYDTLKPPVFMFFKERIWSWLRKKVLQVTSFFVPSTMCMVTATYVWLYLHTSSGQISGITFSTALISIQPPCLGKGGNSKVLIGCCILRIPLMHQMKKIAVLLIHSNLQFEKASYSNI